MKKVQYSITIPDDVDIVSIELHWESNEKKRERPRRPPNSQQIMRPLKINEATDEPDEGLLFDELY